MIEAEFVACNFQFEIEMADTNYKGLLQIHCQKVKVGLPHYSCTQRMQDYRPVFLANLTVLGRNFISEAEFSSKKQAEQNAAKVALHELGILDTGEPKVEGLHEQLLLAASDRTDGQGQPCTNLNPAATSSSAAATADPQEDITSAEVVGTSQPHSPVTLMPAPAARNSPLSFKNVLQERAQKMGIALPQYETTPEGSGFVCTVTFNGQHFKSEGISSSKKLAQQNAASVTIRQLNSEQGTEETSTILNHDVPIEKQEASTPLEEFDATVSYKNLFQENCQQRGNKPPVYSTTWNGNMFNDI